MTTQTPERGYPLVDPDVAQRTGARRLNEALAAVDADVAALLAAVASLPESEIIAQALAAAVDAAIDALVAGAPETLDTLKKIADHLAVQDDATAALVLALAAKADAAAMATALADKADRTAVPAAATAAILRAGTDAAAFVTARAAADANAPVALTDAATIAINLATGIAFTLTLGGNRTLANPTNPVIGRSGIIVVKQDATGSRTLSFGSAWQFQGGVPALSIAAGAVDIITWYVETAGIVRAALLRGA